MGVVTGMGSGTRSGLALRLFMAINSLTVTT